MTATTVSPQLWSGERLGADLISLAAFTATALRPGTAVGPVIAAASDGVGAWVVPPSQLNTFFQIHADVYIACHGAGELHRALYDSPAIVADHKARRVLWELVRAGRLIDVMLLDQLVRLAEDGTQRPRPRTLHELANQYTVVVVRDESAVQALIAASLSSSSAQVQQVVEAEAVRHAEAVWNVFAALQKLPQTVNVDSAAQSRSAKFGLLSLSVQVQGAVALAHARHNGLRLATGAFLQIKNACERARDDASTRLLKEGDTRQWLKTDTSGLAKVLKKGSVDVRRQKLIRWLEQTSSSVTGLHRTEFVRPQGSDDPADWFDLTFCHPLLRAWSDMTIAPEVARSCVGDGSQRLHPQYEMLPRLRSYGPDLDSLRRFKVCGAFEPDPGSVFLAVRLRDLKLRSLAAVCLNGRGGRSTLAAVFARGDDPYDYAAAALAGMSTASFAALATQAPLDHDRWLRIGRILLSTAPRGLSEDSVFAILKEEPCLAGVELVQARTWHGQLLSVIFPELSIYLRDDSWEVMASNMGYTVPDLDNHLTTYFRPTPQAGQLRKWYAEFRHLTGRTRDSLQALLDHGGRYPTLANIIRDGSDRDLWLALFGKNVVTLTGRVRGRLPFGQTRGAEYLDLADDAAQSALYSVVEAGHKVAAYAEETILVEMSESPDLADQAEAVLKLAREGAEEVLFGISLVADAQLLSGW